MPSVPVLRPDATNLGSVACLSVCRSRGEGGDDRRRQLRGVLHRTVGRLLGYLFLVTGDLHEAEEVVQEAFARSSVRWSWRRDYNAPDAWVRRVAMNLAADRARKLRRQARAILRMGAAA